MHRECELEDLTLEKTRILHCSDLGFYRYSALSRYTPIQAPISLTFCLHAKQNRAGGGGVSHVKLPSEGCCAIGGISS